MCLFVHQTIQRRAETYEHQYLGPTKQLSDIQTRKGKEGGGGGRERERERERRERERERERGGGGDRWRKRVVERGIERDMTDEGGRE